MKAIEVENLTKRFDNRGGAIVALDHISFNVENGEIFGMLGPNGSGKTTLIKTLTTLLKPTSGFARVAGFDVTKHKDSVRAAIGVVFQEPALDWRLTGRENLDFHARMYGMKRKEREERLEKVLKLVELEDKADLLVDKYSGGMKRRLELARGFMHHPRILFLDEPTLGLDTHTRRTIWNYIRELNREEGVTIVLTTHYMEEADYLCDRVGIMDHGKIIALDRPENLKNLIGSDMVSLELNNAGDADNIEVFKKLDFIRNMKVYHNYVILKMERADIRIPAIMELAAREGIEIRAVNLRKPSLEDVFLHFTGRGIRE
ncbi:MAG: ATP-binding cassette domain-containing protein [Methanophagales archaeon]|nr:ATP-binding cassette domain-containing protein [Methanophagales archaeon]MCW3139054.1 ATP-binding cassette domain-containing protein [Methanophagales archaeon]MCW7072759.1 ATP-binding cassette domain-containing protein [Methanophagales archaeon]